MGQRLLLRWAEQQWGATRDTLVDATKTLQDFKKAAARLAMGQHAKRFLLEVDTVAWGLLQVRMCTRPHGGSHCKLFCQGQALLLDGSG